MKNIIILIYLNTHLNPGKMIKNILLLLPCIVFNQNYIWEEIHDKREYSISGVALFKDGYLVVHDNKEKKQARVSYIDKNMKITKLIWPERKPPFDLEAVVKFPNIDNRFILMESTGKCYDIFIDPKDFRIDLLENFTLPKLKPNMNLEGLTIFQSAQGIVFLYGDRGSDLRVSTLFTAFFKLKKKKFYDIKSYKIDMPIPKTNKRNIADLAINSEGEIWSSATSDPGDNGPFSTAIYELGIINNVGIFKPIHPNLQKPLMVFSDQKVEAITFKKRDLILMTDNENFGSTFLLIKSK